MAKKPEAIRELRKERAKVDPNETAESRFIRLASKRLSVALKTIHLLGNLSSGNYKYSQEQVDKINNYLTEKVTSTMAKFNPAQVKNGKQDFSVDL